MQRLSRSRYALVALCLLSFADACCSPILPEVLYVPMVLMHPERRWRYAFWCAAMSVLGGVCGYALGFTWWQHGLREWSFAHMPGLNEQSFAEIRDHYREGAFTWVWLGGMTPLPYKLFTVTAGVCKVDFTTFVLASITSRLPRIYATVWLLHRLGKPAYEAISRRFRTATLLVTVAIALAVACWLWA